MAGPAFEPECCLALPTAHIAVTGPEAAVNAVYANKIAELSEDEQIKFVQEKQAEYKDDIDIYKLASEMIIEDVIAPGNLINELIKRFQVYDTKKDTFTDRK